MFIRGRFGTAQSDRGEQGDDQKQVMILRQEPAGARLVQRLDDPQHAVSVQQRHAGQGMCLKAESLIDVGKEARVGMHVVDDLRLAVGSDPAGDAAAGGQAVAAQALACLPADDGEHQLVRLLIEQQKRAIAGADDVQGGGQQIIHELQNVDPGVNALDDIVQRIQPADRAAQGGQLVLQGAVLVAQASGFELQVSHGVLCVHGSSRAESIASVSDASMTPEGWPMFPRPPYAASATAAAGRGTAVLRVVGGASPGEKGRRPVLAGRRLAVRVVDLRPARRSMPASPWGRTRR